MKRRDFLGVSVGIAGAGLTGCTDFADSADFDAGSPGNPSSDGGGTADAGGGGDDAGLGEDSGTDAGPGVDAGPGMDAGPGEMDAGAAVCVTITMTVSRDANHEGAGAERPTAEDVMAAVEKTYDIQGVSPHAHSFTLSPANFATLAGGESVDVTTLDDASGHSHTVTVQCMS